MIFEFNFKSTKNIIDTIRPGIVYLLSFILNPIQATLILVGSSAYLYISNLFSSKQTNKFILWRKKLRALFKLWKWHGAIWHGYEIKGLENIPKHGPALLIFFHASFMPIDMIYFIANFYLERNRLIKAIADRDVFNKIGLETLIEAMQVTPGSIRECVEMLKTNQLVAISPGGLREALFSENYNILWANRSGFAKVATEAKVPVVPIFTKNSQEAMKILHPFTSWLRGFYENHRLLCAGPIGWYPVKLKTIVGKPIEFFESRKVEELVELTRNSIKKLISDNQKIPNDVYSAFLERIK